MDSLVLVILGSNGLKAGLWFAENILHSIILSKMQGVTWKCDHCCLFKHIRPVCISHPGEITCVWAVAIVFRPTKVLMWKIWGGALWHYLSRAMVCRAVITYDDFVCGRSKVRLVSGPPWGHSQLSLLLFSIVSILMYPCAVSSLSIDVISFDFLVKMSRFLFCHPKTQSPPTPH